LLGDNSLDERAYFLANHLFVWELQKDNEKRVLELELQKDNEKRVLELQKDNEKRELELQKDMEKENIEDYFKFHLSFLSQRCVVCFLVALKNDQPNMCPQVFA